MCDLCGNTPHEYNCHHCGGTLITIGNHVIDHMHEDMHICCDEMECTSCDKITTECKWEAKQRRKQK